MFLVAGFFFWRSFSRTKSVKSFLTSKFIQIFIPFVFFTWLMFFVLGDKNVIASLNYTFCLSIFWKTIMTGAPAYYITWFIGNLLFYYVIFSLLVKYVKTEWKVLLLILAFCIFSVLLWDSTVWNPAYLYGTVPTNVPFYIPDFQLVSFLLIFYGGIVIAKYSVIERLKASFKAKIAVGLAAVILTYLNFIGFRIESYGFPLIWFTYQGTRIAFGIVVPIVSLYFLSYISNPFFKKAVSFISKPGLFIYLSSTLTILIISSLLLGRFSIDDSGLSLTQGTVMLFASFSLSVLLSHGVQRSYDWLLRKASSAISRNPSFLRVRREEQSGQS